MTVQMRRKITPVRRPLKSDQVPVTVSMMNEMEDRLIHRMDAGFQSLRAEISGVRGENNGIKSEIHGIKSEIHGIRSEIHGIKSEIHGVKSELHRVALLVEEQNARNKYVMDGYTQLYDLIKEKLG